MLILIIDPIVPINSIGRKFSPAWQEYFPQGSRSKHNLQISPSVFLSKIDNSRIWVIAVFLDQLVLPLPHPKLYSCLSSNSKIPNSLSQYHRPYQFHILKGIIRINRVIDKTPAKLYPILAFDLKD
jgi:hypothetical protein